MVFLLVPMSMHFVCYIFFFFERNVNAIQHSFSPVKHMQKKRGHTIGPYLGLAWHVRLAEIFRGLSLLGSKSPKIPKSLFGVQGFDRANPRIPSAPLVPQGLCNSDCPAKISSICLNTWATTFINFNGLFFKSTLHIRMAMHLA